MVVGILGVICIILVIYCFFEWIVTADKGFSITCMVLLIMIVFLGAGHLLGYKVYSISNPKYVEEIVDERNELVAMIDENDLTSEILTKIKNYNSNLDEYNNLWLRWKKEDDSEYRLDYNYYYNLFMEQQKEKMEGK